MPAPFPVVLVPHDPRWDDAARIEAERLSRVLPTGTLETVHHIGSTAIEGLLAKPILDLLPVIADASAFDAARPALEAAGYLWWGEYGLPGRRYLTREVDGVRTAHFHAYARGSDEITRHLAFRDYVRARPEVRDAYAIEKERARSVAGDSYGYADEKAAFVRRVEADALRWLKEG
jgi:GrpB-like predicted nucleotidyltransferase (UPF0157 family)